MMYSARRMLQQASKFSPRFFCATKKPEHGVSLRTDSHNGLHPKQGKMTMLKNRFRELDKVYGDKSKPLSVAHSDTYDKYHMLKNALDKGAFGQNAILLSPNASLEEAFKVVSGEKIDTSIVESVSSNKMDSDFIEIHITASDYIDFDGMDPRIKLHEPWHETHPMRLTISVPKEHAEEIVIKLRKHPGIIEIDYDLIEEPNNEIRYLK